jgi:hypothetical protein
VFLCAELIDPALGQRDPQRHILAGHLAPRLRGVVGHHDVRLDLHLVAHDGEYAAGLHGQLARLRRPRSKAQHFDVAGVGRLELHDMIFFLQNTLKCINYCINIIVPNTNAWLASVFI